MEARVNHRGPESVQWDRLKGQRVRVWFLNSAVDYRVGKLVWVDRYSIGVILESIGFHANPDNDISIIHRGPGLTITPEL